MSPVQDHQIVGGRHAQYHGRQQIGPVNAQIFKDISLPYRDSLIEEREEAAEIDLQLLQIGHREDDPGQGDQDDRVQMSQQGETLQQHSGRILLPDNDQAKDRAPDNEIEASAMPEAGQKPDSQQVADGLEGAFPAAAQGNIDIVPEPAAQCGVPSAVKIGNARCGVRVGKVADQGEAQHHGKAAGHQGIAPEIKIQLEGIGIGAQPGQRCGNTFIADLGQFIPQDPDPVGQQDFHAQTDHEEDHAVFNGPQGDPAFLFKVPFAVAHDRTLGDLGEHGEIDGRIDKAGPYLDLPCIDIRLEGDHLKDIETHAQGQQGGVHLQRQDLAENQEEYIRSHRDPQILFALGGPGRPEPASGLHIDPVAQQEIKERRAQQEQGEPS